MKKILQILTGAIVLYITYLLFKNIDYFELYLFNLIPVINFNTTAVFTRIILASIATIGIANLLLIVTSKFNRTAGIALFVFSCITFISSLSKHYIVCDCFNYKSLMYNFNVPIVFFILSIFLFYNPNRAQLLSKFQKYILPSILAVSLSIITILSAPDFFLFKTPNKINKPIDYSIISKPSENTLKELLTENDKKLVAFVDPECTFCQKTIIKLSIIGRKNHLSNHIFLLETDSSEKIDDFMAKYHLDKLNHQYFFVNDVAKLNKGKFPYIILAKGENINYEFEYRNIDEKTIKQFFKN